MAYKIPVEQEIKPSTRFQQTIRSAHKCGLLTPRLSEYCEEIKDLRNKIHMASMQDVDDKYKKKLVIDVFTKTNKTIKRIENYGILESDPELLNDVKLAREELRNGEAVSLEDIA